MKKYRAVSCRTFAYLLIVAVATSLLGCSGTPRYVSAHPGEKTRRQAVQTASAVRSASFHQTGIASYYAHDFHGKTTANGERFNMHDLTAAHRTLPFDTRVRVTNLTNDKTVVVRINDRGPFKRGRIIDLSLAAAKRIDLLAAGTAKVRISVVR